MSIFRRMTLPKSELKLGEILPYYDTTMIRVMEIGKCLYEGYLPDSSLGDTFGYLKGFHDYKIYTSLHRDGKKKRRKTLQVPKMFTEYLRKLIYTENVKVEAISENETAKENIQEYLDEVLTENDYWHNSSDNFEEELNIGGAVEYPTVKNNKIVIEFVNGLQFHATEYDRNNIRSGALVYQFRENEWYYTKLIKYTKQDDGSYKVEKELYKARDLSSIGAKVPYETLFKDKQSFDLIGFKSVPFTYKKPRIKNNQVLDSPYGLPLWFNALDTIGDIDLIFDRKNQEVRLGGRTKIIPSWATVENRDTTTGKRDVWFDEDNETFVGLNLDPEQQGEKVIDITSELRSEEFITLLNQSLDVFSSQVGMSPGTFTSDGKSIQTATQVITEKMATYQTKVNQEAALQEQHSNLFMSIIELANSLNLDSRVKDIPDDLQFKVTFDDSVIIDKEKELEKLSNLVNQGYAPKYMLVAKTLNVSEEDARKIVAEAREEEDERNLGFIVSQEDNNGEES